MLILNSLLVSIRFSFVSKGAPWTFIKTLTYSHACMEWHLSLSKIWSCSPERFETIQRAACASVEAETSDCLYKGVRWSMYHICIFNERPKNSTESLHFTFNLHYYVKLFTCRFKLDFIFHILASDVWIPLYSWACVLYCISFIDSTWSC